MKELDIIQFLIDEIREEEAYMAEYEKAVEVAKENAKKEKLAWGWMPDMRTPSKATINENLKKIRKLCLKMYR